MCEYDSSKVLITEKRAYQKDRSRRNAARNKILGQAAKQHRFHVTSHLLNPYKRLLQLLNKETDIPITMKPQDCDQQSQLLQAATRVNTKYRKYPAIKCIWISHYQCKEGLKTSSFQWPSSTKHLLEHWLILCNVNIFLISRLNVKCFTVDVYLTGYPSRNEFWLLLKRWKGFVRPRVIIQVWVNGREVVKTRIYFMRENDKSNYFSSQVKKTYFRNFGQIYQRGTHLRNGYKVIRLWGPGLRPDTQFRTRYLFCIKYFEI